VARTNLSNRACHVQAAADRLPGRHLLVQQLLQSGRRGADQSRSWSANDSRIVDEVHAGRRRSEAEADQAVADRAQRARWCAQVKAKKDGIAAAVLSVSISWTRPRPK